MRLAVRSINDSAVIIAMFAGFNRPFRARYAAIRGEGASESYVSGKIDESLTVERVLRFGAGISHAQECFRLGVVPRFKSYNSKASFLLSFFCPAGSVYLQCRR